MTRPSIITKRLILHPANNDEDLSTYLSMLSPDEFVYQFGYEYNEGLLDGYSFTNNGVVCYAVFPYGERTMLGYVGIMPYESDLAVGELEYYIAKERRGNGYCQEASRALIRAYHSGALTGTRGRVVTAQVTAGNDASVRVLEKLGFKKVGTAMHVYALSNDSGDGPDYTVVGMEDYELVLDETDPVVMANELPGAC